MEELKKALEIVEGEAECLEDYEEFRRVMDMLDELKNIFKLNLE